MDRTQIVGNILTFVPYMLRHMMRTFNTLNISKQQMGLLFHISKANSKPMSYYSEKLEIPKSNITVLTDKLIKDGYVERSFDPSDRRIIILNITEAGRAFLEENKNKLEEEMLKRLEVLSDDEVKRLNELILEVESIFDKLR
ncbi:MAG: MarR family winged helix-turn-helix transcriptional regulator [Pseudomonadota bacterium]